VPEGGYGRSSLNLGEQVSIILIGAFDDHHQARDATTPDTPVCASVPE